MNPTLFKTLVKDAILELVQEGKIAISSNNQISAFEPIKKNATHLAEMIRTNATHNANNGNNKDASLLNLLADTAQTTYVRNIEKEEFGQTSEEKNRFDAMFTDSMKDHFNKLFSK